MNKLVYNFWPNSPFRTAYNNGDIFGNFEDFTKSKGIIYYRNCITDLNLIKEQHLYEFDTEEVMLRFIMEYT